MSVVARWVRAGRKRDVGRLKTCICALPLLLLGAACSDDVRARPASPPRPTGTLELEWSIDGQSDPALCDALGASAFEVLIFDQGFFVGEREAPCADFEMRLDLLTDDYVARTTIVDQYDFPVTRRIVEDFFLIAEDRTTHLSIDFPGSVIALPADAGATPVSDAGAMTPDAGGL